MKIIKYALSGLLVAVAMTGCKKELEVKPTDTISDVNAFLTLNDIQLGTNGVYGRLGAYSSDMYMSALVSDEAKLGPDNAGQGALTYRYQYSSDNTTGGDLIGAYWSYYGLIDQANRVLANLPKVLIANGEEPRRQVLKGQLLALRAFGHFQLLQDYRKPYNAADGRGIAYMLNYDANAKPSPESMGAVISKIETDLNDAYNLLPAVTSANFSDTVMNRVNIDGLRARIALYKGDYASAITYASNVITSAVKPLANGATFNGIWTDANASEVLIRRRYAAAADGAIGGSYITTGNLNYVAPSDKLVATYGTGDIRKAAYIGVLGGANYVNKFYNSTKGGRVVDLKLMRIAEMYLIRAEAYARQATPNIALGTADLNTLRSNRISGYTPQTFATATDLINAVMDERYKELCFEGFRFFDLKRTGLPVNRSATDAASAWQTLPVGNFRFTLPIPFDATIANPNTVQNDGY